MAPAPLYEAKVTVWCGITSIFVLGPYFFKEVTLHLSKHAPSQVLSMQQCCIYWFQNCSSKMSSITLYGCKMVLLQAQHVFGKFYNSTLIRVISLTLLFPRQYNPQPYSEGFLALSKIQGVHIKSMIFVRIERCHKMWNYIDSFCNVTFFIVANCPLQQCITVCKGGQVENL